MTWLWWAGTLIPFARPEYARRLAAPPSHLERARDVVARRREAQRLAEREPQVALEMGLGGPTGRARTT